MPVPRNLPPVKIVAALWDPDLDGLRSSGAPHGPAAGRCHPAAAQPRRRGHPPLRAPAAGIRPAADVRGLGVVQRRLRHRRGPPARGQARCLGGRGTGAVGAARPAGRRSSRRPGPGGVPATSRPTCRTTSGWRTGGDRTPGSRWRPRRPFGYVQNRVLAALTDDTPAIDAVVEELFPTAALHDIHAFYGSGGSQAELDRRITRLLESCAVMGADRDLDVVPTSRYTWALELAPVAQEQEAVALVGRVEVHGHGSGEGWSVGDAAPPDRPPRPGTPRGTARRRGPRRRARPAPAALPRRGSGTDPADRAGRGRRPGRPTAPPQPGPRPRAAPHAPVPGRPARSSGRAVAGALRRRPGTPGRDPGSGSAPRVEGGPADPRPDAARPPLPGRPRRRTPRHARSRLHEQHVAQPAQQAQQLEIGRPAQRADPRRRPRLHRRRWPPC